MAPPSSRRSGHSRRAQYGQFTGYVIASVGALIGAVLLGDLVQPARQSRPRLRADGIEVADHRLGAPAQVQGPVGPAIGRHEPGRKRQRPVQIGPGNGRAAHERYRGFVVNNRHLTPPKFTLWKPLPRKSHEKGP